MAQARWHHVWAQSSILENRSSFIILDGFLPRAAAPCGSHQCQVLICDSKRPLLLNTAKHTSSERPAMTSTLWFHLKNSTSSDDEVRPHQLSITLNAGGEIELKGVTADHRIRRDIVLGSRILFIHH